MAFRLALALALVATVLVADPAAACTMPPPGTTIDVGPAAVTAYGPCPPATNGAVEVRVLDQTVAVDLP